MKRFVAGALALLMITLLCACGKNKPTPTEPATQPPVFTGEVAVTDGFSDTVEGFTYRMPKVTVGGAALETVNEAIHKELYGALQDGVYRALEDGYSLWYVGMDYTWGQQGDLLSILVKMPLDMNDLIEYKAYHIYLPFGELMDIQQFYRQVDATEDACMQRLYETLEYYWEDQIDQATEEEKGVWCDLRDATLQTENLKSAVPFIGENGELCYVVEIYSIAGAETYPYIVNLNGGVTPLH